MAASILLLSISLSIDALGIGSSYGIRGIQIPRAAKCIVALLSICITGISLLAGQSLARVLPPAAAKNAGVLLLMGMGCFIIWQGIKKEPPEKTQKPDSTILEILIRCLGITIQIIRTPQSCDRNQSSSIDPAEAIYLGVALSVDSLGAGLASGAAGIISPVIPFTAACFQVAFLTFGSLLGKKLHCFAKVKETVWVIFSGILLIGIAMLRLFSSF